MLIKKGSQQLYFFILIGTALLLSGCIKPSKPVETATLLETVDAAQQDLVAEVNRFARVGSMNAKMDLNFEDNSFAQFGSKEVYRRANGEVVVQRPASIRLKVQVPVLGTDVAQMTSDGEKFRVAILQDGGDGKYKKFVIGSNNADYSKLQKTLDELNGDGTARKNVNAFANLRPQHFTDAVLVRPTDEAHLYTQSTIFQVEEDATHSKKSPIHRVTRGYYLLDEFARGENGALVISRRFWFDRVGGIRLARQQLFDVKGEIESDIVYGAQGNLTTTGEYNQLPLRITVTRPRDKYSMTLTYQSPEAVSIGKPYPAAAFVLENTWQLEEVDLDKKLQEATAAKPAGSSQNQNTATTRFQ